MFSGIQNTMAKSSKGTLLPRLLQQLKFQFPLFHMQNHLNLDGMSSLCISFTLFLVSEIFSHKFTYKAMEIYLRFHKRFFSVVFLLVFYAYLGVLHHVHSKMYFY